MTITVLKKKRNTLVKRQKCPHTERKRMKINENREGRTCEYKMDWLGNVGIA
jgi:hypothetical protein